MAYRHTPTVAVRLEGNRVRIRTAARDLVAEGGWRQAHVSAVALKAGVATGSVYRYFPSKAELFVDVLSTVSRRERDVIAAVVDGPGTPAERLAAAVETFARRAVRGRRLAYALIAEPCDPEIDRARLHWRKTLSEEFVRLIADGQASGEFRPCNTRTAAACVVGAFMEALIGPLAPEDLQDAHAADMLIHDISTACVAMIMSHRPRDGT
jgi:AcrR family transcriptional regulator